MYDFKTEPRPYQLEAYDKSKDSRFFALLMEQGTGKTKVALDTAGHLSLSGAITGVLVVAPNGVHLQWPREAEKHLNIPHRVLAASAASAAKTKRQVPELCKPGIELTILCVNIEAFSRPNTEVRKWARAFTEHHDTLMIIDESSMIKTPGAKRTQALVNLGKRTDYRRILTGTPITQSPLDAYAQFKFLSPQALGFRTYSEFRSCFAETETRESRITTREGQRTVRYEEVVGYKNVDQLAELIKPHSYRARKQDHLKDLPPKIYQRRTHLLTTTQMRVYKEMLENSVATLYSEAQALGVPVYQRDDLPLEDQLMAFLEGRDDLPPDVVTVLARGAGVRLLRLQQIVGGFLPHEAGEKAQPIDKTNPRLQSVLDLMDEIGEGQVIIWARFRAEIEALVDGLGRENCAMYYGGNRTRDEEKLEFQIGHRRYFVAEHRSGGYGHDLPMASTVVYYSNTFSLEQRLQSEDRAHRIGQTADHVLYIDMEAVGGKYGESTLDERVLRVLQEKRRQSDAVLDEDNSEWLQTEVRR